MLPNNYSCGLKIYRLVSLREGDWEKQRKKNGSGTRNLRLASSILVVQRVGALRHQPLGLAEHRLGVPGCHGRRRARRFPHRRLRRRRPPRHRHRHRPVPPRRHHVVRPGNSVAAAAEGVELGPQQQKHCEQHGR